MFPLELQQGSWASSQVVRGNSGFLSSCNRGLGFPLELWLVTLGTQNSSRVVARTQGSSLFAVQDSGFHLSCGRELSFLLKLGGYIWFLSCCFGASYRDVLGRLVSSRDVQVGFSLVTMCR